jgi:hypothetical protein
MSYALSSVSALTSQAFSSIHSFYAKQPSWVKAATVVLPLLITVGGIYLYLNNTPSIEDQVKALIKKGQLDQAFNLIKDNKDLPSRNDLLSYIASAVPKMSDSPQKEALIPQLLECFLVEEIIDVQSAITIAKSHKESSKTTDELQRLFRACSAKKQFSDALTIIPLAFAPWAQDAYREGLFKTCIGIDNDVAFKVAQSITEGPLKDALLERVFQEFLRANKLDRARDAAKAMSPPNRDRGNSLKLVFDAHVAQLRTAYVENQEVEAVLSSAIAAVPELTNDVTLQDDYFQELFDVCLIHNAWSNTEIVIAKITNLELKALLSQTLQAAR